MFFPKKDVIDMLDEPKQWFGQTEVFKNFNKRWDESQASQKPNQQSRKKKWETFHEAWRKFVSSISEKEGLELIKVMPRKKQGNGNQRNAQIVPAWRAFVSSNFIFLLVNAIRNASAMNFKNQT